MSTSKQVHKHVFLEYSEYERLLDAYKKNEELLHKVKDLEEQVKKLKSVTDQQGTGINTLPETEYQHKLQRPLIGVTESITTPPSARIERSGRGKSKIKKEQELWYFLGPP